jgi:hypothetical protein
VPAVDFRVALDVGIESVDGRWNRAGGPDTASGCTSCSSTSYEAEYWNTLAIIPSIAPSLRLNLGSIYSMAFGFRAGFEVLLDTAPYESKVSCSCYGSSTSCSYSSRCDQDMESAGEILAHVGPEWSLLSFRMGAKREMELEFWQGIIVPVDPRGRVAYNQGLSFRYLFLGDPDTTTEP